MYKMRNIGWTAAAAALLAGLTACGNAQQRPAASASSLASTSPVTQPAAAAPSYAPPPPDPCASFSAWASAGGAQVINAVNKDWTALQVDASASNAAAVASDGRQLALDATAALDQAPSPIATQLYKSAMRDMVKAGEDLEAGNYAAAEQINISSLINRLTSAVENQGCSF